MSVKEKFVVENLNDLKNNKLVGKNEENIERYKKIIQNMWKKNGVTKGLELHLTMKDLKDKTNKWWQAGSAHSEMIIEPMEIENSNETILKAKEHHMNTETRKAIFVALMGAQDYVDGYNRIMQLNLKGEKEREIVYVLMYCLGQSKTYNKYFELVAIQLLQNIKSTKFTFQLSFYDKIKELESHGARSVMNWATLLGVLILDGFLNLKILKSVNMISPSTLEVVFVRTVLQKVLCDEQYERVVNAFQRLIALNDVDSLKARKSIHLFLMKKMGKPADKNLKKLIEKRSKLMIKMLNSSVDALM